MKLKRTIGVVLASALLISSLAGCGAKKTANNAEDLSNVEAMTENTLPITEEPITLNIWMKNSSQGYLKSYNDAKVVEEIKKRTGVTLNFIHPTGAEKEQLNIILSSNDYPDIIVTNWGAGSKDVQQLKNGIAVRLNDYIDKYAPNVKKVFSEYPEIEEQLKTDMDLVAVPYPIDKTTAKKYYPTGDIIRSMRGSGAIITSNCQYIKEALMI